jgi:acyl carrier protein
VGKQLTKEEIRVVCVKAVVDVTGHPPQTVADDAKLADDLCMDDLDLVEVIMEVEGALGVEIPADGSEYKVFGELVTAACKAKGVNHG